MQLTRLRGLAAGSIARADLEQQELLVRKGQAELKAGEESLQAAELAFEDSKKLAEVKRKAADAEEKRAIQAVPIDALTLGVESAREKEKIGRIVAPVDGKVVRVQTVVGEMTTQVKPILQLAASGALVVRAEIPDAEVDRVRKILARGVTIKADITSRSLKKLVLQGELSRPEQLAQAISRNAVVGLSPENEADRRVIEATIQVLPDKPEMLELARTVLGLQVEVELLMPE
jgi:HlyD family secretion protein